MGTHLTVDQIVSNLAAKINQNDRNWDDLGNIKAVVSGNRITLTSVATDKAITITSVDVDELVVL